MEINPKTCRVYLIDRVFIKKSDTVHVFHITCRQSHLYKSCGELYIFIIAMHNIQIWASIFGPVQNFPKILNIMKQNYIFITSCLHLLLITKAWCVWIPRSKRLHNCILLEPFENNSHLLLFKFLSNGFINSYLIL